MADNGQNPVLSDEEVRDALTELGQHPSWQLLFAIVKYRMDQEFLRTANELLAGQDLDPKKIAWKRGFFAGMKFIVDQPSRLAVEFQEALEAEQREE